MMYVYHEYYAVDGEIQQAGCTASVVYELLTTCSPYGDESDPDFASNIVFSSAQVEGYDYAGSSPRT